MASLPSDPRTPSRSTADPSPETSRSTPRNLNLPIGDSPYARAKHAQMVDKDPNRAVALFWAAINSGDRVDSALKDMAVVMKQLNRAEEAIEAIKSFRGLCSFDAQEPLDNVLLDLYKKCGKIDEQIELMRFKLKLIDEGLAFGGRLTKSTRSQGKKHSVSISQERARLLGNLAWAYVQAERYKEAEPYYWQALDIEPDYNKQCNLAICLMQTGRLSEAKSLLRVVPKQSNNCSAECYIKSFERAWEMLNEFESQSTPTQNKEETVQRITTPLATFNPPNLSNDFLSPSPSNYFTPQSEIKMRTWLREFRPPLSVNRNLKHMSREPWKSCSRGHSNFETAKAKEYSVEAQILKPGSSPEVFMDEGRSERAARNHELKYRAQDISAKAPDKQSGGSFSTEKFPFGSWKSPRDSDNFLNSISRSLQPMQEPSAAINSGRSCEANVVVEVEEDKFQTPSAVSRDDTETPTTSCFNLEATEYLVKNANQTPFDISKGERSEGLTFPEKYASEENIERREWGQMIEEEEQFKKHSRIKSQANLDGMECHIQNKNQQHCSQLPSVTLNSVSRKKSEGQGIDALSQGRGRKITAMAVDKYVIGHRLIENNIEKEDAKKVEAQFCTPSVISKGRRTWADMVEEEEEKELANESEGFGDENVNHNNFQDLRSQDFTNKFCQKLNLVDLKKSEGSKTPSTGASSARRSLTFNLDEWSVSGNGMDSRQPAKGRDRMQVFRDITLDIN